MPVILRLFMAAAIKHKAPTECELSAIFIFIPECSSEQNKLDARGLSLVYPPSSLCSIYAQSKKYLAHAGVGRGRFAQRRTTRRQHAN